MPGKTNWRRAAKTGSFITPFVLTHWGRVTHICVSKLITIGSDNDLSPGRRQAIIWTNDGVLLIRTSGTNFSELVSEIRAFSLKKMHLKMSSAKWRPFCLGLNVLIRLACHGYIIHILGISLPVYWEFWDKIPLSWNLCCKKSPH